MLAEIFMVRLEAAARLMEETIPSCASRFTPFIVGARFTAQAQQPPQPIAAYPICKYLDRSELREAARVESIETAFDRSRSQRSPYPHRPCDALEVLRTQVVKLEQVAHELARTRRNHNSVGLRNALQARGKVRRLADDCLFLRSTRTNQVANHHHSGCNADARLKNSVGLQIAYRSDQFQPTARSASSS